MSETFVSKFGELRWDRETGKAADPNQQPLVDELRQMLASKDVAVRRAFFEKHGLKWCDHHPV